VEKNEILPKPLDGFMFDILGELKCLSKSLNYPHDLELWFQAKSKQFFYILMLFQAHYSENLAAIH
jgi:hypothetical protein